MMRTKERVRGALPRKARLIVTLKTDGIKLPPNKLAAVEHGLRSFIRHALSDLFTEPVMIQSHIEEFKDKPLRVLLSVEVI